MDKRSELYQIEEPEAPVKREALHLAGMRSHDAPATPRPVGPPWPRQQAWRDLVRRLGKNLAPHRGEDR